VTGPYVVEPLSNAHDRKAFTCGVVALDRYFREQVTQDVRRRVTNCFVAVDGSGTVAGYYTFAATSLPLTELTVEESRRLPRHPLLPAALIGRLAVAETCRKQGLGVALILDAIERTARAETGIYALIVDAKDDEAVQFYTHVGFRRFASRPMSLFLPVVEALREMHSLR
jgi:GNAT superfamily N-acetyltransferase